MRPSPLSKLSYLVLAIYLLGTGGCLVQSRINTALAIAAKGQLEPVIFHTSHFDLQGYQRFAKKSSILTVYIEGDGAAWQNRTTIASDPTPKKPTGLTLARQDPTANILYLARPCQYRKSPACTPKQWTSHRYSPEIIRAMGQAIDEAKRAYISEIILIGYSGGGVIATLLAAERDDIAQIITVAANLDINYWTTLHRVTPLWGSSNPCNYAEKLQHIPQIHIVGKEDRIVPLAVTRSYINHLPNQQQTQILTIPGINHHGNWSELWPAILTQIHSGAIRPKSL